MYVTFRDKRKEIEDYRLSSAKKTAILNGILNKHKDNISKLTQAQTERMTSFIENSIYKEVELKIHEETSGYIREPIKELRSFPNASVLLICKYI